MKNIFITTAMLFAAFYAFSQNVGIGETGPATKLEIKGDAGTDLLNIKASTGLSRLYVEEGGSVGIGTNDPDDSAILDIQSTNKGVLFPRMTTTQRGSVTPVEGMTIFNTSTNCMDVYSGSAWKSLCPCNAAPSLLGSITGAATNLCKNSTGNMYSVVTVPGASFYQWTVPANYTIASGQGSNSISINLASNAVDGTISVLTGNNCGISNSSQLSVALAPIPANLGTIAGLNAVCPNATTVAYSVTNNPNVTSYTWSVPAGAVIASGQTTNSITVDWATTSGNVSVIANNCNGSSAASNRAVTVLNIANPVANAATSVALKSFTANWNSVANATGYRLDVSTTSDFSSLVTGYNNLDVSNDTTRSITGLGCVTTYYYRVRAYNSCSTSGNSNAITQATATPSAGATNFPTVTANTNFIVPECVTSLTIKTWGAGGAGCSENNGRGGGGGGFVHGIIAVTPGETLIVRVGGGGNYTGAATNGGGSRGGGVGGGGGGYSGIFRGVTPLAIAGGGGGGGRCHDGSGARGGGGGGLTGGSGTRGCGQGNANLATGGSQSAGGASGTSCGATGGSLTGGTGCANNFHGGGGGGGYFGGGGGPQDGAGGGGSSYTGGMSSVTTNGQGALGNGFSTIDWASPAGTGDVHWGTLGNPGQGGPRTQAGIRGGVRIIW